MATESKKYWLGFNKVAGIGSARTNILVQYFDDLQEAWNAPENQLLEAGLGKKQIQALFKVRHSLDLDAEIEKINRLGITVLTINDPDYPRKLSRIEYPPPVLFVKGSFEDADLNTVAVVGTRRCTSYGKQVTRELAGFLARNQITVVSGLARGVDGIAHRVALDEGGRTIAVLGCGIDIVYPSEHRDLAGQVINNGALISDYYPGTPPDGRNFPPRNRIIAGLSQLTVVVEAGERSGAIITAEFAASQGRDVFAIPGSIYAKRSKGTNRLIRDGAFPLLDYDELLQALNMEHSEEYRYARKVILENDIELLLMKTLAEDPMHVDEISAVTGIPIDRISATLSMMRIKGLVNEINHMTYLAIGEVEEEYEV